MPFESGSDLPMSLGGPPGKGGVSCSLLWGQDTGIRVSQAIIINMSSLGCSVWKKWPYPKRSCRQNSQKPQDKQQTGWEHSQTHYKTGCLMSSQAHIATRDTAPPTKGTRLYSPEGWHQSLPSRIWPQAPVSNFTQKGQTPCVARKATTLQSAKKEITQKAKQNKMAEKYKPEKMNKTKTQNESQVKWK